MERQWMQQCSTSPDTTSYHATIMPTRDSSSFPACSSSWPSPTATSSNNTPHNSPVPHCADSALRPTSQPATRMDRRRRPPPPSRAPIPPRLLSLSSAVVVALMISVLACAPPAVSASAASGAGWEGEDPARQLCGRMLMSHMKRVCTQPVACGGQPHPNKNGDLSNGGRTTRQKRQVRDLFRQCCTQGCTRAFIRDYCCGDSPPSPESQQLQQPRTSSSLDNAALPQQQQQHRQPSVAIASPCQYHAYSVHSMPMPTPTRPVATSLLDGDNAEFSSGNLTHLLASNSDDELAARRRYPHHRHRHHRRPASTHAAVEIDNEGGGGEQEEVRHRFEKLKRALLLHKATDAGGSKLNSASEV